MCLSSAFVTSVVCRCSLKCMACILGILSRQLLRIFSGHLSVFFHGFFGIVLDNLITGSNTFASKWFSFSWHWQFSDFNFPTKILFVKKFFYLVIDYNETETPLLRKSSYFFREEKFHASSWYIWHFYLNKIVMWIIIEFNLLKIFTYVHTRVVLKLVLTLSRYTCNTIYRNSHEVHVSMLQRKKDQLTFSLKGRSALSILMQKYKRAKLQFSKFQKPNWWLVWEDHNAEYSFRVEIIFGD